MRHLLLYLFAATKHPHKYCSNLSNPTIISSRFAARKVVSARRCATAKATRTLTYHRYTTRRDLASSLDENEPSTLLDSNDDDDDNSSLTNRLRQAFQVGQTDGVLQHFATTTSPFSAEGSTATMWVQACIEAADGHKGTAVSMLNACLGAIVVDSRQGDKGSLSARRLAADMLTCLEVDYNIKPDMLTYALVYSACQQNQNDNNNNTLAANVLDKAQRLAKKLAGSSRRKALAAARRKAVRSADDAQDALQALLGEDFAVLAEMNDYVVVNKPSGTVCHHNHATTAGKIGKKNADVSLVDALLHVNVPLSTMNAQAQGLVHRLDRGTSGCIILAKTDHMHALLVTEFFLRQVHKTYRAIVSPVPASCSSQGTLNSPVDGRPAQSDFWVVEKRGQDLAMVEMKTFTGRKHQVRVHAASGLETPVLMDTVYGEHAQIPHDVEAILVDLAVSNRNDHEQFFLHAASLDIPRYSVSVSAKEPAFWKPILDLFD